MSGDKQDAKPVAPAASAPLVASAPKATTQDGPRSGEYEIDPPLIREIQVRERALAEQVSKVLGLEFSESFKQYEFRVERDRLIEVLKTLRDDDRFQYEVLVDLTALDNLKREGFPERFSVIYQLFSHEYNARLRLRVAVPEEAPRLPSASGLFGSANWAERECFDMFGIEFDGHPELERILMPSDFGSYPLRKDYPLRGRGERDDFPRLRRGAREDL